MTVHAIPMPQRRGACPGLSAPMPTGDGLLVRLLPIGTIPLAAFADLCAAARTYGNGVIEITSRGSIQVRGLSAGSAPRFAAAVAALGIAAQDGIPVHLQCACRTRCAEILDAGALAAICARARATIDGRKAWRQSLALRSTAAAHSISHDLPPTFAFVRKRRTATSCFASALAVTRRVRPTRRVAPAHGVEAVMRLLDVIAQQAAMRARATFSRLRAHAHSVPPSSTS